MRGMCVYTYTYIYIYVYTQYICVYIYNTYASLPAVLLTYMHVCMFVCMYVCMYVCIHAHTHTHQGTPRPLEVGAAVEIHSLHKSPELNGVRGEVVESEDLSTGRCQVKTDTGRFLALKPVNLKLLSAQVRACVCVMCICMHILERERERE